MNTVKEQICPLCGGENGCAMAVGEDAAGCWCREVAIDPAVLKRLPAEAVGRVCICPVCAATGRKDINER